MNIKISKEEHKRLTQTEVSSHIIGSHLYGVANENSDKDILHIYNPTLMDSYEWGHINLYTPVHQFQYDDTENNTQHMWCTEAQFFRNMIDGESTINVDLVLFEPHYPLNDEEKLQFLRTYKIIKAYIGLAKRDLKRGNKIEHVDRGLYIAECLINNELPVLKDIKKIYEKPLSKKALMLKEGQLRYECNRMFDDGELQMYYIPSVNDPLLQKLINSKNTKQWRYSQ